MAIERVEVDGVPTFFGDEEDGMVTAALVFRVGFADETLATRGITHLLEHLTLHALGRQLYDTNGFVTASTTTFIANGVASEVAGYLRSIAAILRNLPYDRIDRERQVLATEARRRPRLSVEDVIARRFGPRGVGLSAFDQLGLRWIRQAELEAWRQRFFTRDNCAIWSTHDLPDLRDDGIVGLPRGERVDRPRPAVLHDGDPGWFRTTDTGCAMSVVLPRGLTSLTAVAILRHRLEAALRTDQGLSYDVGVDVMPIDAERHHAILCADALPHASATSFELFDQVVRHFSIDGPTAEELAFEQARLERARPVDPPLSPATDAHVELGVDDTIADEFDVEGVELSAEDVHRTWSSAGTTVLYAVPVAARPPDGVPEATLFAGPRPAGTTFASTLPGRTRRLVSNGFGPSHHVRQQEALVVSDDAVGIEVDGQMFSIAYDDCVATMWWQDGARSLIGVRGEELRLVPWRWVDADVAFAEVDAHVAVLHTAPSGVTLSPLVPMTGPSPGAPPPRDPRSAHRRVTWVFALLALASTLFAAGFLVLSPDLSDEDSRRAGVVGECDGVPTFSFLFGDGVDQVDDERSQLCDDAAGDNVVGAVLCLVFGLVFGALAVREGVLAHRSSGFSAPGPPLLRDPPPGPRVDGVGEPLLDAAPD